MNPARLLIVDDEANIRFVLDRILRPEGYDLAFAADGADAIRQLQAAAPPFDLMLLDLSMEPVDGIAVLDAAHRQDPELVVIILTAHSSLESAVDALRLGAFDYLFKPASTHSIRERVAQGLQRRQQSLARNQVLNQIDHLRRTLNTLPDEMPVAPSFAADQRLVRSGPLSLDTGQRQAVFYDQALDLTTAEFDLLVVLVKAAPMPLSPRELVNRALGYDTPDHAARELIKWHVHNLRKKLQTLAGEQQHLKTVRHKGYLWVPA